MRPGKAKTARIIRRTMSSFVLYIVILPPQICKITSAIVILTERRLLNRDPAHMLNPVKLIRDKFHVGALSLSLYTYMISYLYTYSARSHRNVTRRSNQSRYREGRSTIMTINIELYEVWSNIWNVAVDYDIGALHTHTLSLSYCVLISYNYSAREKNRKIKSRVEQNLFFCHVTN